MATDITVKQLVDDFDSILDRCELGEHFRIVDAVNENGENKPLMLIPYSFFETLNANVSEDLSC